MEDVDIELRRRQEDEERKKRAREAQAQASFGSSSKGRIQDVMTQTPTEHFIAFDSQGTANKEHVKQEHLKPHHQVDIKGAIKKHSGDEGNAMFVESTQHQALYHPSTSSAAPAAAVATPPRRGRSRERSMDIEAMQHKRGGTSSSHRAAKNTSTRP